MFFVCLFTIIITVKKYNVHYHTKLLQMPKPRPFWRTKYSHLTIVFLSIRNIRDGSNTLKHADCMWTGTGLTNMYPKSSISMVTCLVTMETIGIAWKHYRRTVHAPEFSPQTNWLACHVVKEVGS